MSFLHAPGDLAQTPLAAILIEALGLRATGVLTVEHGNGTSRLFLRGGKPVGAQVFFGFRPLGQYLLGAGLIDMEALEKSLAEMARTGRKQGQLLVEMGAITQGELDRALADQQGAYVAQMAALDSGTFRFDGSAPVPEWTEHVRIPPLRLVVDALEAPPSGTLVGSALQQAAGQRVALSAGYPQVAPGFAWTADEERLVARLGAGASVDSFFADAAVAPERARAILAALLLLGVASPAAGAPDMPAGLVVDLADVAAPEPPPPAPPPTPAPGRRSDPAEARARRQRLLSRAMQNMGVGPLSRPGPEPPVAPPPTPAPFVPDLPTPEPAKGPRPKASATEESLRRALDFVHPRTRERDYFARLGIPRTAGRDEVKQAYLALAKQFHPDRFLSPSLADLVGRVKELFSALNEAYEVLSDNAKRAEYLRRTAAGPSSAGSRAADDAAAKAALLDYKKGEACLKTRDFARARGFLEAAIRVDAKPLYLAQLAWALVTDPKSPDRARAKELLAEALGDPTCDRAFYVAGVLAREDHDEDRAEKMFRLAYKADPRNVEAEREVRLIDLRRRKRSDR